MVISICINYGYFKSIHKANGVNAYFTIINSIVFLLNGNAFKYAHSVLKLNLVLGKIMKIFLFCPSITHILYLHNVNMNYLGCHYYDNRRESNLGERPPGSGRKPAAKPCLV